MKFMDTIKLLRTIDFIEERVDLNSVHPRRLRYLVQRELIEKVDPGDGEEPFYLLTSLGDVVLNVDEIPVWLRLILL